MTVLPYEPVSVRLARVLASCDAFIHAGAEETFGLVLIEAMACGTPIVCSDLPVLREVGGVAAEYCPPGDPSAFAQRITTLLEERQSRPTAWAARRSAGLARSAAFSWERYASAMQGVYRQVAGAATR